MKVRIVSQYFAPEVGATQARLAAFVQRLHERGYDVEVLTALPNYPDGHIFRDYRRRLWVRDKIGDVPVLRVPLWPAKGRGVARLINYLSFCLSVLLVLPFLRKCELIFVESPPLFLAPVVLIIEKLKGGKVVVNIADLWPASAVQFAGYREGTFVRWARAMERWVYQSADVISAATRGIEREIKSTLGKDQGKVTFLPNGVDADAVRPLPPAAGLREQLGIPGDAYVALYLGTIGYAHGIEVIVKAAELVADDNIWFLVVGAGSEKASLERAVSEKGLLNVVFHIPVPLEDVAKYYSIADVGLSTLRDRPIFEGTRPVKVISNMAAGKPVIYVGKGEGAELVKTARAGLVTPPESSSALASALREVKSNPALAKQMGREGRRFVEENLTWSGLVDTWLVELQRVLLSCRKH